MNDEQIKALRAAFAARSPENIKKEIARAKKYIHQLELLLPGGEKRERFVRDAKTGQLVEAKGRPPHSYPKDTLKAAVKRLPVTQQAVADDLGWDIKVFNRIINTGHGSVKNLNALLTYLETNLTDFHR